MSKRKKTSGVCVFCNSNGVTKQHFWPDWMGSIVPAGENQHLQFLTNVDMSLPPYAFIQPDIQIKRGHAGARKIRKVCGKCNNGWMSVLETAAKGVLTQMIFGEEVQLSLDNQSNIAAWTMMTAIIGEYTDITTQSISLHDREYLMNQKRPNSNWRVWLGKYIGEQWNQHYSHVGIAVGRAGLNPIQPSYNTQSSTFVVGELLIYAVSSTCLDPDIYGNATRKSSKVATKIVETYGGQDGQERQMERRAKDGDSASKLTRRSRSIRTSQEAWDSRESNP